MALKTFNNNKHKKKKEESKNETVFVIAEILGGAAYLISLYLLFIERDPSDLWGARIILICATIALVITIKIHRKYNSGNYDKGNKKFKKQQQT